MAVAKLAVTTVLYDIRRRGLRAQVFSTGNGGYLVVCQDNGISRESETVATMTKAKEAAREWVGE